MEILFHSSTLDGYSIYNLINYFLTQLDCAGIAFLGTNPLHESLNSIAFLRLSLRTLTPSNLCSNL